MFRIRKTNRGYIVEIKKYYLGFIPYRERYISTAGLDIPRFFSSYEFALDDLLQKIRRDIQYSESD